MLILCEKPSVAKDFAKALGAAGKKGFYELGDKVITYCVGHLFELCPPEAYNPAYKKWSLSDLPIVPNPFRYDMNESTAEQTELVISLLKRHAKDDMLIATDAGREGELIARIVLQEAGITDYSRIRRFWVSEALTADVIFQGMKNAKPLAEYDGLAAQAFARQRADWLTGINLTRFMSVGSPPPPFSVGRVQTAVLAAVAARNDEIKNFVPAPYKKCEASITSKDGVTVKAFLENPATGKPVFFPADEDRLSLASKLAAPLPVDRAKAESKRKNEKPEKLLNITGLQKIAFKRFGYKPEETLNIAQSLYETHKCLSYPRTPSRVMGDNNVDLFLEKFDLLKDYCRMDKEPLASYCDRSLINEKNKHIFNSSQLEDHHALIPLARLPDAANEKESNIYGVVLESFLTVCMPDFVYNSKTIRFYVENCTFVSNIREVIQKGWKAAKKPDAPEETDEEELSAQFIEDGCTLAGIKILEKFTEPKKEFAIDTLLAFMEHPRGEDDNAKLAGLGTPATRAEIIKTLFAREYLKEEKKKLYAAGRALFLLCELDKNEHLRKITDVGTTTDWEQRLLENPQAFEKEITAFVSQCVASGQERASFQEEPLGRCPLCGKPVFESKAAYGCSGYKDAPKCPFAIWKTIACAAVSPQEASLLLIGQKTKVKKCKNREGKPFEAEFALEGGKVVFKFVNSKK
jgi:DNA topoisomerase-3